MSLNGNLEDLPLLDILQIVSFSRKTGYLAIRTPSGEGAIVFRDGFVVSSFAWDSPPLDPRARALPDAQRQKIVRNRIAMALEQLIRLREGHFSFSLTEATPALVGERDITDEVLTEGINAQELLLDLARGMDEDRRDSTAALEASFAEPGDAGPPPAGGLGEAEGEPGLETAADMAEAAASPGAEDPGLMGSLDDEAREVLDEARRATDAISADDLASLVPDAPEAPVPAPPAGPDAEPAPAASASTALPTVLVVDDEPEIRHVLAQHFGANGYAVTEAEDPDSAMKAAAKLGKERTPFVLVSDLGMPTSGGTSFQGGFEVVKRLVKMNLRPPVLLMTESLSNSVRLRAQQLGITNFVFKPGLSKLDPEQFEADLRAFAHKILADILPRLVRGPAPPFAPSSAPAPTRPVEAPVVLPTEDLSRHFTILQQRLDELRKPQDASQISVLVMKTAREFFERGILFLVKNDELRGLGGFGKAAGGENLNLIVREIAVPLIERSPFSDVAAGRKPFNGKLPEGRWTDHLFDKIGRFKTTSVTLLPLLTNRETVAVLFGDNPETGRDVGRLDALAVFMNQAGIALENAFLQRKVHALQGQE